MKMVYSGKIVGDVVIESESAIRPYLEFMMKSIANVDGVFTKAEELPAKHGKKFRMKMMFENDGKVKVMKANWWYDRRSESKGDYRLKYTVRGPTLADEYEVEMYRKAVGE